MTDCQCSLTGFTCEKCDAASGLCAHAALRVPCRDCRPFAAWLYRQTGIICYSWHTTPTWHKRPRR